MKAIICAAGRGMRLGRTYADRPKILLEVGGATLFEWHCRRLKAVGVHSLVVVTGWQRDRLRSVLNKASGAHGLELEEIFNPDYTEGSALSVKAALSHFQSANHPVLLMDGDVLYPMEMLRRLIRSPHRTALLIDRHYSLDDDDPVLVPVRGGKPVDFIKQWKGEADQVGESIGFFKLDPQEMPLWVAETVRRGFGPRRFDSYDEIIRALVWAGRFGAEDVTGLPWTEIDFPKDVELARRKIFPEICKLETR